MCGWRDFSWPFFFHERQADAFSCAMPIRTTLPSPPSSAAARSSGSAIFSLLSPLAK